MSTLSTIVVARHPSDRVSEILAAVRPVTNELIVAVDDRAGADGLGAMESWADVVATFHFEDAIERPWAWIAGRATSDWILWLDDDELPSPALLASITGLLQVPDVTHYHVRRRWIWPDAGTFLAEPPWDSEFIPRLFRADRALVWYPGRFHLPVKQIGPFRWIDDPIYHLDLILNPEARRREKAVRYEHLRPGLRIAGRPLNDAFYVPESRAHPPATSAVPSVDREVIERFVGSSPQPVARTPATRPVVRGTKEQVDEFYRAGGRDDEDEADLELLGPPDSMLAGTEHLVEVRIHNRGRSWWPADAFMVSNLCVSYRWYRSDGSSVEVDELRTGIPMSVAPGATERIVIQVIPPDSPGDYVLGVALLREHVRWLPCERRIEVRVLQVPSVGVLVGPAGDAVASDVVRILTEALPGVRIELLARTPASTTATTGYASVPDPTLDALAARPLRLLACALTPVPLRLGGGENVSYDVVVLPDAGRIAGSFGRREALALAATVRRLQRSGVGLVMMDSAPRKPIGILGRLTVKALSLSSARVLRGKPDDLVRVVAELAAPRGQAVDERPLL